MTALTARQILDRQVSEREFMDTITAYAKLRRWEWYHTFNSMHSRKGFPDLVLVRDGRLVFAEVKRQTGSVSDEQQYWIDLLTAAGAEAYVWRPSDWEQVKAVLR